jgi:hypothetical protein
LDLREKNYRRTNKLNKGAASFCFLPNISRLIKSYGLKCSMYKGEEKQLQNSGEKRFLG